MRVLILGSTGHIGGHLKSRLEASSIETVCASRSKPKSASTNHVTLNTMDKNALAQAMKHVDAVVNCVAGDAVSIAKGSEALVDAALETGKPRLVHMSTMSVYGRYEGIANESTAFDPELGWYAAAKCKAEEEIKRYCNNGGSAVVLRPGCVHGPGSELWVGRVGRWLQTGRLGDLGAAGDGWSNLVHINDVTAAIETALNLCIPAGDMQHYNLAATDSPRWNEYFIDLARAIDAVPVKRVGSLQIKIDSKIISPAIKISQLLLKKLHVSYGVLPDPMPPALVRFFGQQILLDASSAKNNLGLDFTSYEKGIADSADWFKQIVGK